MVENVRERNRAHTLSSNSPPLFPPVCGPPLSLVFTACFMLAQTALMAAVLVILFIVWKIPSNEKVRSASWEERDVKYEPGKEGDRGVEMNELDRSV